MVGERSWSSGMPWGSDSECTGFVEENERRLRRA